MTTNELEAYQQGEKVLLLLTGQQGGRKDVSKDTVKLHM